MSNLKTYTKDEDLKLESRSVNSTHQASLNLTKVSDNELLINLEKLVCSERKLTETILKHILEVETRKLFLTLGYESLYKYLTQHLGYSESAAYDRLQAARLLKSIPSVGVKLQEGKLNLTQLVKVEQSLKQEKRLGNTINLLKTEEVLNKLENKTSYESEKILATEFNYVPKTHQRVKPQQDDSVRVEITLIKEQYESLKHAQSLLSHVVTNNNLSDVIAYLAKSYVQKKEGKPQKLANENKTITDANVATKQVKSLKHINENQSAAETKQTKSPTRSFRVMPKSQRKYLPINMRRELFNKAQNCCEHVDVKTQRRCGAKYQLQIDHIRPLAKDGVNEVTNLRVLCGVHNRAEALKWGLGY